MAPGDSAFSMGCCTAQKQIRASTTMPPERSCSKLSSPVWISKIGPLVVFFCAFFKENNCFFHLEREEVRKSNRVFWNLRQISLRNANFFWTERLPQAFPQSVKEMDLSSSTLMCAEIDYRSCSRCGLSVVDESETGSLTSCRPFFAWVTQLSAENFRRGSSVPSFFGLLKAIKSATEGFALSWEFPDSGLPSILLRVFCMVRHRGLDLPWSQNEWHFCSAFAHSSSLVFPFTLSQDDACWNINLQSFEG